MALIKNDDYVTVNVVVDISEVELGAKEVLKAIRPVWDLNNLKIKHFSEGITNKLFGCSVADDHSDVVMFRIFGEKTELIIDREAEKQTFLKLSKVGCSPPLYCVFNNGLAYGFVKGQPIGVKSVRDEQISRLIAKEMVKIHSLDNNTSDTNHSTFLFKKTESFLSAVPVAFEDPKQQERFINEIPNKEKLKSELSEIQEHLESLKSPIVFCHNDLLLNNIIYDKAQEKIGFIDYEYAFYNYQAFDIADHFCEFAGVDEVDYNLYPNMEFQFKWLRVYLEYWFESIGRSSSEVTTTDVEKLYVQVNKCALAAHFFWAVWAIIQAKNSTIDFDFLEYAQLRFGEYFKRKTEFLSLRLP